MIMNGATRIYVSSYDYAKYSDLAKIKTIQKRISEIPFGVDTKLFKPLRSSSTLRKKLGINANDRVVMFVGQLDRPHYFKGVPVLIEAFSKVNRPRTKLVIVGGGDLQGVYVNQAKNLGIKTKVIFTGSIEYNLINEYFSVASFTVLPSTDNTESYGMVLLEAQATGKAVITSNLPGVRTVVRNNEDGLLVNPNDANDLRDKMRILLDNSDLMQLLGKNGRKKIKKQYTWDRIGQITSDDIYKAISSGTP